MARPREFDEQAVLDAAIQCFWRRGYEATSVRDLVEKTGITSASLYNAFGDKRALYQRALDRYVEESIAERIRRCEELSPRAAIGAFFLDRIEAGQADGTITRSLSANDLAHHLLGVLMGVRVLARVRPEPALLRGVIAPALALLDRRHDEPPKP